MSHLMNMIDSPIARASWVLRTPDFGALRDRRDPDGSLFATMRYQRPDYRGQTRTTGLWSTLLRHRYLLEVVDADGCWVDLRYAAIDWKAWPTAGTRTMKLTWALELAEVLDHVARCVDPRELGWLASPFVKLDLEQHVRIGFSPIAEQKLPPETLRRWPRCDERGLVFVAGKLLSAWALAPDDKIGPIVTRCTSKARRRYETLVDLQEALVAAGAHRTPLPNDQCWDHVEIAVGLMMRGLPGSARDHLERARDHELARALLHELDSAVASSAESSGRLTPPLATRPREVESPETLELKVRGLLAASKPAEALSRAEELVALHPEGGRAHYLRGRCLFALRRFAEARDAFALASTLSPMLLEAMLLRRESERALACIREVVGTQRAIAINLPAHLAALASVIASGNVEDAITILDRAHSQDAAAQLVLANCLAFAGRIELAIAAYDRAEQLDPAQTRAARIGKAFALLDLGRPNESLEIFDAYPDDLDALEGRARALERLGREDADRAFRKLLGPIRP